MPRGSFNPAHSIVYFGGHFRPLNQCHVHPLTHALHYGTGVFEGIRGYWDDSHGQLFLFRAEDHFRRWRANARLLDLEPPLTARELCELAAEVVRRNKLHQDVYIRPLIYHSRIGIGVAFGNDEDSEFMIAAVPWSGYLDHRPGLHVCVSSWRRVSDNAIPSRAKLCGAYVNSALASRDARRAGFQDAILLNESGTVAEGSAFNIFLVRGHSLITPANTENILEGITRDTVLKLAAELKLQTEVRPVGRSELYVADEIFFTGTAPEVAAVTEVDHRPIGYGKPGKITSLNSWCYPVFVPRSRQAA